MLDNLDIQWLGHATVKIKGKVIIYIDPYQIEDQEKADIILITHGHHDHCSLADIRKIVKPGTQIFFTPDCQSALNSVEDAEFTLVLPNNEYSVGRVTIKTIPAYNIDKQFHPKENEWVGYIVQMEGKTIYHAGDTDFIPEMENLEVDVAFLPVGGTYTMDAKEAAAAASKIKAKKFIPMHYGSIIGTKDDAEKFLELIKS